MGPSGSARGAVSNHRPYRDPGSPVSSPRPPSCSRRAQGCQGWPSLRHRGMLRLARPHLDSSEHGGPLGAVGMTIRGEPAFGRGINRATTLYPVGPRTRTMMQSSASAAKLRSGGPILPLGMTAMSPDPATSNRHRRPVTSGRTGPKLSGVFSDLRSLRWAQNDAFWHHALSHEPPKGDQKLARQGHDHGLASAAGVFGAGSKPLRASGTSSSVGRPQCPSSIASTSA